ncbi:MAG: GTP-binding protein, partial [Planctomycetes bacterium]|nr:GTP-binding protein [Planctomycetota bacterium]
MARIDDIRNIVLLGHGGSGKTSLTEAILHKTGTTNRLGAVEDKTTVCDFDDEEKQRGHSIHSALAHANYGGKLINIIDTPGYPDFVGAALLSIPAAEAAVIVVSASSGIEMNTRKLFAAATKAGKPRIVVINKMDAENADLGALVGALQETFGASCRCANLCAADKTSVIDCLANDQGDSPVMDVAQGHTELIESIVEADDDLMESYLGGEEISKDKIAEVFKKALVEGTIVPIVFTDCRKEVGITEFLDLVCNCVPSPGQAKPTLLIDGETETEIKPDPNGPLCGLVFRVGFDPRSNMKYSAIRIFSGKLTSTTQLHVANNKKALRPGHPLKMQGTDSTEVDEGAAGDIVALAKLEELHIGDLISDGGLSGTIQMPAVPTPMFSLALEPASRGDEGKIGSALDKLCDEDRCFKVDRNKQTKELVISGLGDLHLRVMLSKMENRYKIAVNTKP